MPLSGSGDPAPESAVHNNPLHPSGDTSPAHSANVHRFLTLKLPEQPPQIRRHPPPRLRHPPPRLRPGEPASDPGVYLLQPRRPPHYLGHQPIETHPATVQPAQHPIQHPETHQLPLQY